MNALGLALFALVLNLASALAHAADYGLHVEPSDPVAGEHFEVVASGNACEFLFIGDPYGDGAYDEVSYAPGTVRVQVGYEGDLIFPCDHPPNTVRLSVGPLEAGTYRLELHARLLFSTEVGLLQAVDFTVGPRPTRTARVPSLTWIWSGILLGALASTATRRL